jgi:predicted nucleotidyltransferase
MKTERIDLTLTKRVRLDENEITAIKRAFTEIFGRGRVILFGSRTNPKSRGGDIDLYLIPEDQNDLRKKKRAFSIKLDLYLGERKVDIILQQDVKRPIEQEALTKGVDL